MKYLVGDMVNGTLNSFDTLEEAERCYADYAEEGTRYNQENMKNYLGEDNEGIDIHPASVDASKFYYIQEMEEVKKLKL